MSILSLFGQTPNYDYQTYGSDPSAVDAGVAAGVVLGGMLFAFLAVAIVYVVTALCLSRIFKKAGIEGWKAWVPFYNTWILLELGGQQGFWAVLALIPIVNIVAAIFLWIAMYHVGLKLGKPGAFVLLGIFLPLVWMIWLAVDNSKWEKAKQAPAAPQPPTNTAAPVA